MTSRRSALLTVLAAAGCGIQSTDPFPPVPTFPEPNRPPVDPSPPPESTCPPDISGWIPTIPAANVPLGAVVVVPGNLGVGRDGRGFFVVSLVCTHAGCIVTYNPDTYTLVCPCHASLYQQDGTIMRAARVTPPQPSLTQRPACLGPDGIIYYDPTRIGR